MNNLQLKQVPITRTGMLIRKPVADVFGAFVDPEITTKFWFTKSSGWLEAGKQVRWDWEMYGISVPVTVKTIEPNKRIVVEWPGYSGHTTVEWVFAPQKDGTTFVSITEAGFSGDGDELVKQVTDSTQGFSLVLAGLKAFLEHNVRLNLVADRYPKGIEEHKPAEKTSWEMFFDGHAPVYDENEFTKNTVREVDFLLEELGLAPGCSILDVGCGTGRHSIELSKRGYAVTGLDLSSEMLARAASAAKTADVHVEWIHSDAAKFSFPQKFDAAICLCEGAFGLLGPGDDPIDQPLSILRNISRSLKPQAKVVFTVLNGAAMLRRYQNKDVAEGRFDPLTIVESSEHPPREGMPAVAVRERGFVPTELMLLFRMAGMSVVNMWGGTAGNWGRRTLDLDEVEIMIVARKTAEAEAAEHH